MGLKNLIKGQLLSSISYRSSDPQELAAVYDRDGRRIMYESVLTVMPGQAAILVNEGQMTDIFMPGRYELTTNNMPVTTTLNMVFMTHLSWILFLSIPMRSLIYHGERVNR